MGSRTVELALQEAPAPPVRALLEQAVELAQHFGARGYIEIPESFPGLFTLSLDANSSYLTAITSEYVGTLRRIATDIDPTNREVAGVAEQIASRLEAQMFVPEGEGLRVGRVGRELTERAAGEASHGQLLEELDLHAERVRAGLQEHATASGPSAWRRRLELEVGLRVDGLSLVGAARRIQRLAVDVRDRLDSAHLGGSLAGFETAAPGVVEVRNIAEHLDQYVIGQGWLDPKGVEPGEVLAIRVYTDELVVSGRGYEVGVLAVHLAAWRLAGCLESELSNRGMLWLAPIVDIEFTAPTADGARVITAEEEGDRHRQLRAALASLAERMRSRSASCPTCGWSA